MFLGIEIGGTKLQVGLGNGLGAIDQVSRIAVIPADGAAGILQQILQMVPELLFTAGRSLENVAAIGVGFGGPVDDTNGQVIKSHQIEGWNEYPLAEWLREQFGRPVALGNDSDVAGLAEALFGAGKGTSPLLYMNIGSGIGGALVTDGEVYRGSGRGAVEIGHLRGLRRCEPGQPPSWRILEDVASGWSIERRARQIARNHSHLFHPTPNPNGITVREVGDAAAAGLDWAQQLLLDTWTELAEALCQAIVLLAPRRIVIGGGVALLGEKYLFAPLRQLVAERVFAPFAGRFDIVPAALGEEVVVHGAIALARKHFG